MLLGCAASLQHGECMPVPDLTAMAVKAEYADTSVADVQLVHRRCLLHRERHFPRFALTLLESALALVLFDLKFLECSVLMCLLDFVVACVAIFVLSGRSGSAIGASSWCWAVWQRGYSSWALCGDPAVVQGGVRRVWRGAKQVQAALLTREG